MDPKGFKLASQTTDFHAEKIAQAWESSIDLTLRGCKAKEIH
eukprot:gene6231-2541_t